VIELARSGTKVAQLAATFAMGGLWGELWGLRERGGGHDPGRVMRDLAVMLANGGDCLSDLAGLGEQEGLFDDVASAATAFRVVDRIAAAPNGLQRLGAAHARRARAGVGDRRSARPGDRRGRRDASRRSTSRAGRRVAG
jgi:hypothetical protein